MFHPARSTVQPAVVQRGAHTHRHRHRGRAEGTCRTDGLIDG